MRSRCLTAKAIQYVNIFNSCALCNYGSKLLMMQDEVVKLSPHARAIRDVEDEELRGFFYGMSPWQVNDASMKLFIYALFGLYCRP